MINEADLRELSAAQRRQLARSLAAMEEAAAAAKGRPAEKPVEVANEVVPPPHAHARAEQRV